MRFNWSSFVSFALLYKCKPGNMLDFLPPWVGVKKWKEGKNKKDIFKFKLTQGHRRQREASARKKLRKHWHSRLCGKPLTCCTLPAFAATELCPEFSDVRVLGKRLSAAKTANKLPTLSPAVVKAEWLPFIMAFSFPRAWKLSECTVTRGWGWCSGRISPKNSAKNIGVLLARAFSSQNKDFSL